MESTKPRHGDEPTAATTSSWSVLALAVLGLNTEALEEAEDDGGLGLIAPRPELGGLGE